MLCSVPLLDSLRYIVVTSDLAIKVSLSLTYIILSSFD